MTFIKLLKVDYGGPREIYVAYQNIGAMMPARLPEYETEVTSLLVSGSWIVVRESSEEIRELYVQTHKDAMADLGKYQCPNH